MILRSIKWRLQLWHGLILILVLSGFGYTAFELQRTREFRRVDQELQDRMASLLGPLRRPGHPPGIRRSAPLPERRDPANAPEVGPRPDDELRVRPPGPPWAMNPDVDNLFPEDGLFFFGIWDRDGRLLRSRALPDATQPPSRVVRAGFLQVDGSRQLHQQTPRGERVLVGRSIAREQQEMANLAFVLVLSGGSILALGLVGGWVVATRAMRPIATISQTAQKIATGDLSQRIAHEESESELGRLVALLNSTFARLESSFAEQTRFTTDVSHELRTPVTVIVSQTQMALLRDRPAAEYREALEACHRAAQRMRRLIESLLQLARLDAGQEEIRAAEFDLAQVAKESVELVKPLAIERKVEIEAKLVPIKVKGDSDKISQVITNLLSNAIYYSPNDSAVRVENHAENGLAILSVSDTGIGIPPEDLPHIFDRFYRVDTSRTRDKGGSGLGLAITRAIVHAHGGTIDVASEVGRGTSVTVRLPT